MKTKLRLAGKARQVFRYLALLARYKGTTKVIDVGDTDIAVDKPVDTSRGFIRIGDELFPRRGKRGRQ